MYEILGLPIGDGHPPKGFGLALYTPDSRERITAAMAEACQYDGGRIDLDLSIRHGAGHYVPVRVQGIVRFLNGQPAYLDGTMTERDVSGYAGRAGGGAR